MCTPRAPPRHPPVTQFLLLGFFRSAETTGRFLCLGGGPGGPWNKGPTPRPHQRPAATHHPLCLEGKRLICLKERWRQSHLLDIPVLPPVTQAETKAALTWT